MQNAVSTATSQVKQGMANGALIPAVSCHTLKAGGWRHNFTIHVPHHDEPVFAAEGSHHRRPDHNGLAFRPTHHPPTIKVRENAAIGHGNLLLFHQLAGTDDNPQHHIRVILKPLGDSGEAITLEAVTPAGATTPMNLS